MEHVLAPVSPSSPSSEPEGTANSGADSGTNSSPDWRTRELLTENAFVGELYNRLEAQRELATTRLREIHLHDKGGTAQSRMERDTLEIHHTRRLSELHAAEYGLCFGRIENADGARQYIGRIALADEDHEPLLTDWRASAAEPFYRATPAAPGTVAGRRHLRSKGRTVVDFDDDAFGVSALEGRDDSELSGESALLASLNASRTGRMGDIVSTIQAEQDRVIRSELGGVLVVQGGPGTGKTVVALHRAAYLLYTHRDRLARSGVLVIGPNTTFLRYIDQVLPALGESEVVLSSIGTLYPGVTGTGTETPEAAAVKGDARMTRVLAAALEALRQLPEDSWTITVGRRSAHQEQLQVSRALCERAHAAAHRSREPHNTARADLVERLSSELALRIARDRNADGQGTKMSLDDVADLADALVGEPDFQALVGRLWPLLTPEQLLTALFGSPELLARAMPDFSEANRAAVLREQPGPDRADAPWAGWAGWTDSDVPLLDEAAELLGPVPGGHASRSDEVAVEAAADAAAQAAADAAEKAAELEFAKLVLDDFGVGLVEMDARMLARQYRGEKEFRSLAERAAEDRTWGFGHVIVDEAQELSPMAWRLLTRRCPGRSMTIVGDLAQTGAAAGLSSWNEALDEYTAGRWRTVELTVNYRTPAEIMRVTEGVLRAVDPALSAPTAVRSGGNRPWSLRIPEDDRAAALRAAVEREIAALGGGRMAVIHAPSLPIDVVHALAELDGVSVDDGPSALDSPVVLMTAAESKGLEFDAVLVVEPTEILAAHTRGVNDLYVALTRATKTLGVVHTGELPQMLQGLDPR
jgi:DNA helicase IV